MKYERDDFTEADRFGEEVSKNLDTIHDLLKKAGAESTEQLSSWATALGTAGLSILAFLLKTSSANKSIVQKLLGAQIILMNNLKNTHGLYEK